MRSHQYKSEGRVQRASACGRIEFGIMRNRKLGRVQQSAGKKLERTETLKVWLTSVVHVLMSTQPSFGHPGVGNVMDSRGNIS